MLGWQAVNSTVRLLGLKRPVRRFVLVAFMVLPYFQSLIVPGITSYFSVFVHPYER